MYDNRNFVHTIKNRIGTKCVMQEVFNDVIGGYHSWELRYSEFIFRCVQGKLYFVSVFTDRQKMFWGDTKPLQKRILTLLNSEDGDPDHRPDNTFYSIDPANRCLIQFLDSLHKYME